MVSSLNHHVRVLKLRVHRRYMQYITHGTLPDADADADAAAGDGAPAWMTPVLHRTRWFDLFDADDRVEAMRGIWGVVAYLMRAADDDDDGLPQPERGSKPHSAGTGNGTGAAAAAAEQADVEMREG